MMIEFVKATEADAAKFVEVQNKSFYADYLRYGECPGYGRTAESIAESMKRNYAYKITADGEVVGKISASEKENGECHLDCLCVIPEYENRGIGRQAVSFIEKQFPRAIKWSLETPADKVQNHYFYQKCGYKIIDKTMDGNVEIVIFGK
jgi:ribosomal protein S18 acetylase RimI-like enzyme